jgi:hypothetical protein
VRRVAMLVVAMAVAAAGWVATAGPAGAVADCGTTWHNAETINPKFADGSVDSSVLLILQFQTCTFQGDPFKNWRAAVRQGALNGRLDVAYGLKTRGGPNGADGGACLAVVQGHGSWHATIGANRTDSGTPYAPNNINDGPNIYADVHVHYANRDSTGNTNPCRSWA